jgi:hypothetical protein
MKTKSLILAASIICATAAMLFGAWVFIVYKSYSYKNQIATISEGIKTRSSEDSFLISLKSTLREAKNETQAIESRFILKEEVPSFITMLENKADTIGVKVDFGSINIEEGEVLDGTLKLQITGSGDWSEVTDFIVMLDSLPYAATIEEIRIYNPSVMSESEEAVSDWKFVVSLRQYLGKKI